ncbi:ABC transporter substrate-binding protein [Microbacterium ulmi]|uniref:Extracellular solute-binding protein n=1 Tax=Microbacterium ulmi TaxID=179095 RepID=A0A7Y2M474_9MICO|nr:extracellular solute-binding protein [Microbacterium ulmi]NII69018.1 multiple sugar transport system substrate-binding protein [Microbacterium ulmi]NNH05439.1 extracellular solute-binding protein [Microbacterium ulmi]
MFSTKRAFAGVAIATGAALALAGCAGGEPAETAPTFDPNEKVTLDLAFWGNDVRADMYTKAIAAFNEEYPNITVNASFLGFPEFWEKRQIEAAGGDLPDVMQFDYSYLRQYSENGLLLDLGPYLGNIISTDGFSEQALSIGVVDDTTTALPVGTNAWAMFLNDQLLDTVGVDGYEGDGSWEDYSDWIADVTDAGGGSVWGASDWTGRIQNFELQLRAEGKNLFNDDSTPGFTEDDLSAFWEQGDALRAGASVPQQRLEEIYPKSGFGGGLAASELTWDNFGAGYLGDLGVEADALSVVAPPTAKEGSKDLYLKPSMLHAISASTEHPEAAATLVDFLLNSEEVGAAFGTNRGIPASSTQLAGVDLDPLSQKVYDYESAIADRLGDAPPVPVVGYGTLEEKFRVLGTEIGLGTTTVDDAVTQFFSEISTVLG